MLWGRDNDKTYKIPARQYDHCCVDSTFIGDNYWHVGNSAKLGVAKYRNQWTSATIII